MTDEIQAYASRLMDLRPAASRGGGHQLRHAIQRREALQIRRKAAKRNAHVAAARFALPLEHEAQRRRVDVRCAAEVDDQLWTIPELLPPGVRQRPDARDRERAA